MKRIGMATGLIACAYVLWFGIYHVDWEFAPNDETTSLVSSVEMLNGSLHLSLYEQRMWDAVLWTVIETKDQPAPSWPAHNAVIKTTGRIVTGDTDLGFSKPPTTLVATSSTTAKMCSGDYCQQITCSLETRACTPQPQSVPTPVTK